MQRKCEERRTKTNVRRVPTEEMNWREKNFGDDEPKYLQLL
jgi:hypothetical protein